MQQIVIVTSTWHLKRTKREYDKHFKEVIPVPVEFYSINRNSSLQDWLPQISGLEISTKVFHEFIGIDVL